MRRPILPSLLLLLVATIFSVLERAHGAPVVNPVQISSTVRQGDQMKLNQPTQLHTVHTTQTALGPVTETCDIRFTPFKARNGDDLVREDRKCLVEFVPNNVANPNGGSNSGNGNGNSGNNGDGNNGSSTDGSSTSTSSGATIVSSSSGDGSTTSTTSAQSSLSTPGTNGSSDSSVSLTSTATPSVNSAGSSGGAPANDNSPSQTSGGSTSTTSSTTSAAPDNSSSNFKLPGTQLSVLPIGLGVFAGVSVIALIVVGLVTYERTKYRKAFRQRKLAEQGQAPGMSERPTVS